MTGVSSLAVKLIDDSFLDENGRIKNDLKFNINNPTFKIQNSKFLKNPDDKYDTMLFLPEGEDRKGEGGLRTKGYFKFSYKKVDDKWFICDFYGNIIKEAPENIQEKIKDYINSLDENQNINDLPLITVITVVFNGAKTLEETIQSVINQTYPNVEYIIIDGGSTDGTLDIIKKYEDRIDYWVSEKDEGIYDAMNKGASVALGSWLYFLGSDDVCFTDAFQKIHKHLDSTKKAVYGNVIFKNKGIIYDGYFSPFKLAFRKNICHQAIFYSKKVFNNFRYNNKYKILADYALNLIIFSELDFKHVDITVAIYNDSGISSKEKDIAFNKDRKKILQENIFKNKKSLFYQFHIYQIMRWFKNILKHLKKTLI